MSDTPRTDAARHDEHDPYMAIAAECSKLERELNAASQRIKRLEDRIHRTAIAFFRDGSDGHVASQMLQILEEERGKV